MAKPQRFFNPAPQFFYQGSPASGHYVFFYQPSTTTKINTYPTEADALAGTNANSNPMTLDSEGRLQTDVFTTQAFKMVLAPGTDTDPPTNSYKTVNNVTTLGQLVATVSKTANYTITTSDRDKLILVDSSGGAVTLTLPAAASAGDGFNIKVKKIDSSSNGVIVDGNASETLDGATTLTTTTQYSYLELWCNGTGWHTSNRATNNYITQGESVFTASGTFNVPSNVNSVYGECWGAGGGGGATNSATISGGAGGGGGYSAGVVSVTPSGTVTITIGAGGAGGAAGASNNGSAGGDTSIGSSIVAKGGAGGTGGAAGAGGAGGDAGSGTGTIKLSGQTGGASTSADWPYSAGGAAPLMGICSPSGQIGGTGLANTGVGGSGGNNGTAGGTGAAGFVRIRYSYGNVATWS